MPAPPAVDTRSSGQEALELLRERQEQHHQFDLVLSDVYMPGAAAAARHGRLRRCSRGWGCLQVAAEAALQRPLSLPTAAVLLWRSIFCADMDGFKLLEHIGLELDLPVISARRPPGVPRCAAAAAAYCRRCRAPRGMLCGGL